MGPGSLCKAGSSGRECMYPNIPPVGARSTMWQQSQTDVDLIRGLCWVIDFFFFWFVLLVSITDTHKKLID